MKKFFLLGLISIDNISTSILNNSPLNHIENNPIIQTLRISTNNGQIFTCNGLPGIFWSTGITTAYYFIITPLLNNKSLGGFLLDKYCVINGKFTKEACIYFINNFGLYPALSFLHNGYYDPFIFGVLLSNSNSIEMKQIYYKSLQLNGIHGICILTYSGIVVYFFNSKTSFITTIIVKYGIAGLGGFIQWYLLKGMYKNSFLNILEFACGIHAKYISGIHFNLINILPFIQGKSPQELLEEILQQIKETKNFKNQSPYFSQLLLLEKLWKIWEICQATIYIAQTFPNQKFPNQKESLKIEPKNYDSNNNTIQLSA